MSRFVIVPEESTVWIEGTSSIHGIAAEASGLAGWIEYSPDDDKSDQGELRGEVRIEVERLESGNSLVDRETRRRVDARRHPEILGTVNTATQIGDGRFEVTGEIDFRGEVCEVAGELCVSADGNRIVVEGEQGFDVRDWGLKPPKIGLLRVHPDVQVRISATAEPSD